MWCNVTQYVLPYRGQLWSEAKVGCWEVLVPEVTSVCICTIKQNVICGVQTGSNGDTLLVAGI